jgi:gluconolactonase
MRFLRRIAAASLPALAFAFLLLPAMAQTAPAAPRHDLSEICSGEQCTWEKVVTCDGFIEGINFDDKGRLWMVSVVGGRILRVENGRCVAVGAAGGSPNGAKFAPDGRLIVADRKRGLLSVDPATGKQAVLVAGAPDRPFRALNDLDFDAHGGFYFTDPGGSDALHRTGRVYYAPPGARRPEVFADGVTYPNGVAVSADGQLVYVAEFAENRILAVPSKHSTNPFAVPFVFARLQGGIGPDGLAVDAGGNVYAVHYGAGEVAVFDSDGFPYGTIPLPMGAGLGTTNLTFRDGYLYVAESLTNTVWRVPVKGRALLKRVP